MSAHGGFCCKSRLLAMGLVSLLFTSHGFDAPALALVTQL
jgi:hypothetical protein